MMRLYAVLAVAAVSGLIGGSALYVHWMRAGDIYADCRAGQVAGDDIGGPFTLVDQTGVTVTETEVITGPTLIYFGYTFCPDVCPLDAARNAEAVDILDGMGIAAKAVFITFDPKRDTPEVLSEFTRNLDPRMVGLTGSEEQVRLAAKAYRAFYQVVDAKEEFYFLDHSTFTYLMKPRPDGKPEFMEFYQHDVPADAMAKSVACFAARG